MIIGLLLACGTEQEMVPEEAEQKATQLAIQQLAQSTPAAEKSDDVNAKRPSVAKRPAKLDNAEPAEILYSWNGVSGLHQSFFTDSSATQILSDGLRGLPSPVLVEIRWVPTSAAGDLGYGEIALMYELGVTELEDLQWAADVLMKYRNNVGNFFDMRILSFRLAIENQDCRVDVISKVAMNVALLSPCLRRGTTSLCAEVNESGTSYSPEMKKMLSECFYP